MTNTPRTLAFACLAAGLATAALNAQTDVVNWGGEYVGKTTGLVLPTTTVTGGTVTYPYSDSAPVTALTNYVAPSGRTGPIYAALQTTSGDGTPREFAKALVRDRSEGDDIYLQTESKVEGTNRASGLFFAQKQDFLAGQRRAVSSLDGVRGQVNITVMHRGTVRLAALNDERWYLSETNAIAAGLFAAENLGAQNWGAWDPTGAPFADAPSKFDTPGASLTNVSAFGFYFDAERAGSAVSFAFDAFAFGGAKY